MRPIALVLGLVAWSAGVACAETVLRGPLPGAPRAAPTVTSPVGWSATVGSVADQARMEGRLHFGAWSVGLGALARVGDASRALHYEGVTAGVRAEHGPFAIDVDWVDFGEHLVTRLEGGVIAGDTVVVPPHAVLVRPGHPTRGILLAARFHRAPFALDVRTVTRSGADQGKLLAGQALAELELGRAALLAGFGRPARFGRLGYEPQAFAGVSWSLGPHARASTSPDASYDEPTAPAFHAFRSGGRIRLEVDAPGARQVEVASDVSAWEPVALAPAGRGRWEGLIEGGPGALRILMRVDGAAWQPPPGLPVAHEPSTGDVGILILGE